MAAEQPVAFAYASTYEPVAATGAGVTVHPDDPVGLADAVLKLAAGGPEARAQMGAAGRAYVTREHTWSTWAICRPGSWQGWSGPGEPATEGQ